MECRTPSPSPSPRSAACSSAAVTADLGAGPSGPSATSVHRVGPQAHRSTVEVAREQRVASSSRKKQTAITGARLPGARGPSTATSSTVARTRRTPHRAAQPEGVHGPSQVVDLAYPWGDGAFRPDPCGTRSSTNCTSGRSPQEGTFAAAVAALDDLVELGVTAVEVMPVAQFPGRRNWGYDGVFPFAVQNSYGGPAGLQEFRGRVPPTPPRRGAGRRLQPPRSRRQRPRPASAPTSPTATARPGDRRSTSTARSPTTCGRYFLANARQWFEDFHVDALRLDAVHELIDRTARPFLVELSAAVEELAESRRSLLRLIAESADNNPLLVTPVASRTASACDAQWNDDFHHAVHAVLTGERDGYYGDYGRPDDVARAMSQGFVYQGQYSAFRQRRHGAPVGRPATRALRDLRPEPRPNG